METSRINLHNHIAEPARNVSGLEILYDINRILAAGTQRKQALADIVAVLEKDLGAVEESAPLRATTVGAPRCFLASARRPARGRRSTGVGPTLAAGRAAVPGIAVAPSHRRVGRERGLPELLFRGAASWFRGFFLHRNRGRRTQGGVSTVSISILI